MSYIPYSICIPTYKRPSSMCALLSALSKQIHPAKKIYIVEQVDNNKNELTKKIKEIGLENVEYFFVPYASTTKSKNIAIKKITTPIVLICDDDTIPCPIWSSAMCDGFKDKRVMAVTGRTITKDQSLEVDDVHTGSISMLGRVRGGFSSTIPQEVDTVLGCNSGFRTEIFSKIGLFDEQYTGNAMREETDISIRIRKAGWKIVFIPKAELVHLRYPSGGARKSDDRIFWYYHYFSNETYFFLKHFHKILLPIFIFSKIHWVARCMFGFGREVSVRSFMTPIQGIVNGLLKYRKYNYDHRN